MQRKNKTVLIVILLMISVISSIFFTVGIILERIEQRQGTAYYATLPIVSPLPPSSVEVTLPPEDVEVPPEDTIEKWEPNIDFVVLRKDNPDITAWIYIEDTVINYPVVLGNDNEYYLNHLPSGEKNKRGSIFMDYRNKADFSDKMTLIYGHNMKNGEMFSVLNDYTDSFYLSHPTVWIFTPEQNYKVELIAGYKVNSAYETPPMTFKDDKAFSDYVKNIKSRSTFKSSVEAEADDQLVCFCTCNYSVKNGRFIVVGKMTAVEN